MRQSQDIDKFCPEYFTFFRIISHEVIILYKCCYISKKILIAAAAFSVLAMLFISERFLFLSSADSEEEAVFLPVIMYHSICDNGPQEYIVTPQQLESDLQWLSSHGYTAVSAKQVCDYTHGNGCLPPKPVMITADDGHYNNLSQLLPLLEKYDMCAVISIVGSYTDVYAESDPHQDSYSYLTWDDINTLTASGRIEIGSHTYDMHSLSGGRKGCAKLSCETAEEYRSILRKDLSKLQNEISRHTGQSPVVFAYPFGAVSRESLPVIRELGFSMTLTCREGPNYIVHDPQCLYGIFRYNRSGLYSTEEFMRKLMAGE